MKHAKLIILCTPLLLAACQERVVHKYQSENSIYFFRGAERYNAFVQNDSLTYNFMTKQPPRQRDTVYLRILTAGFLSPLDRHFQIAQINRGDTLDAIPGEHYIPLDNPEMANHITIPAGSVQIDLPVVLLRHATLRSREVRLQLQLQENQNFKIAIPDNSRFIIKITDMVGRPNNWDTLWQYYLGDWGPEKMRFLVEYIGITDFEGIHDAPQMTFYRSKAIEKLAEYNQTHQTPLAEADGTLVTFPA
jgi:hypothetical protein